MLSGITARTNLVEGGGEWGKGSGTREPAESRKQCPNSTVTSAGLSLPLLLHNLVVLHARALDFSESGVTYPAVAVERGKTQEVELFADLMMLSCSNVSDSGESILAIAVQRGFKMFRRVLDLGVDARLKGRNGRTAIHEAARVAGGARCLDLMLGRLSLRDLGRALNDRDERGLTPLHWAAKETNAAALNLLIGYGANVSARDYNGCTALDILAQKI